MKDIAEAGFSTVQTSPANKCNGEGTPMQLNGDGSNGAWWWHYQPTDWQIGNYQLGSRDDFKAMCAEAKKYGVKIIVDVLPNHTTPDTGNIAQGFWDAVGGRDNMYHANATHNIIACGGSSSGGSSSGGSTTNQGKNVAYLKLPSGWSAAYAYVYNDDEKAATVKENAKWPGEKMTEVSSGLYKYEMPTGYDNPLIIFNDGNGTKYPADSATDIDAAGLKCTGTMICDVTSSSLKFTITEPKDNDNNNNNDDSSSSFDNKAIMLVLLAMIASGSAFFVAYRKKDM